MDDVISMKERHAGAAASRRDAVRLLAAAAVAGGAIMMTSPAAAVALFRRRVLDAIRSQKGLVDMAQDLANLVPEHFEPLIGDTFSIGEHQVTLRNVRRRGRTTSRFREQFALLFSLPHEVPIGSELLSVSHPAIGRCDLLVTQVIDEAEGTALEICFS
jgi:hypothetical protein